MNACRWRLQNWIGAAEYLVLGSVLLGSRLAMADIAPNNIPTTTPAVIAPTNASPELKEFLQNRATLARKMATVDASDPQALIQFQQQNAALLQRQTQLSQLISQQQTSALPTPPQLQIPPNASAQLKAFLIAKDQLARDEIAFTNQHLNDDPATKAAAIQQWQQQTATRRQQLQQMAQALSTSN